MLPISFPNVQYDKGMAFFLGYTTALACLRTLREADNLKPTRAMPKPKAVPDVRLFRRSIKALPPNFVEAIAHSGAILVAPDASSRCRSKELTSRTFSLPANQRCFLELGSGFFIASPELCFAQLAKDASLIELIKLGFEFCGTYSLDPSQPRGFCNRKPLTTSESITKTLEALPGNCPKRARYAARFLQDRSASPMETCLALMLGLPASLGGYGLGLPYMNAEVSIAENQAQRTNYPRYHCDLYWAKQRVALEYNSREFHLNEKAAERDASRVNDLLGSGIKTVAVTRRHIADPSKMDVVAKSLASLMGKRVRTTYADIDERRTQLRKQLFAKDRWT